MTDEEYMAVIEAHNLWLTNQEGGDPKGFRDADLSNFVIPAGTAASRLCFWGANCQNTDFRQAVELHDCDFHMADLTGANFEGVSLHNCNFRGAILDNCNLAGAALCGTVGDGKYIKTFQISNEYNIVYTHDRLWVGCWEHQISDWINQQYDHAIRYDDHKAEFFAQGGKDGISYAKNYAQRNEQFISQVITVVDPAVSTQVN